MKALDQKFTKIINGTTQFVIPVFQRDYTWTESQCDQLWNDVVKVSKVDDGSHFLGSVVYIQTGDTSAGFTRWLLIDGQQRVTTLMLMLTALRDFIKSTNWVGGEDDPSVEKINAYFLKNVQEKGERELKLVLRNKDQSTLKAIIEETELPADYSEYLVENYEYFLKQIAQVDPSLIYKGIGRLVIVDVTLQRGIDDPQLIFESLNSTGIDLSQSDLIRNFILMRLTESEQTRLYENYWNKIEILFRGSSTVFDNFIRDYLALKTQPNKQEKASEIYQVFRRNFEQLKEDNGGIENLLVEMLRFARYHSAFSIHEKTDEVFSVHLKHIRKLADVPAILIIKLFDYYENKQTLSESEFCNALSIIETYLLRRSICGLQTRGYWLVFAKIAYTISESSPHEDFLVKFARLPESNRFPKNKEFKKSLSERNLYGLRVCKHLLDRIENHNTLEPTDTTSYSIEHVLPQNENLVAEWRKMLGKKWKDIQQAWLHRLGNLTLTAYNSKYSDRPFQQKLSIEGGFSDSSVRLNKYIREQKKWTNHEISYRTNKLADESLNIWPDLVVDEKLIKAAEIKDKRLLAKRRDINKVGMSENTKMLFNILRKYILEIDNDIIELAESKSVSYHGPDFFIELLPRKYTLNALLPLQFGEIDSPPPFVQDASEWKFFFYAQYGGGVVMEIRTEDDIQPAMAYIRQAFNMEKYKLDNDLILT